MKNVCSFDSGPQGKNIALAWSMFWTKPIDTFVTYLKAYLKSLLCPAENLSKITVLRTTSVSNGISSNLFAALTFLFSIVLGSNVLTKVVGLTVELILLPSDN